MINLKGLRASTDVGKFINCNLSFKCGDEIIALVTKSGHLLDQELNMHFDFEIEDDSPHKEYLEKLMAIKEYKMSVVKSKYCSMVVKARSAEEAKHKALNKNNKFINEEIQAYVIY